jgi:hypothetical protein
VKSEPAAIRHLRRKAVRKAPSHLVLCAALLAAPSAAQVWEVGNQLLWQPGGESFARFGEAFAVGDFDDDGFDDLAVGGSRASTLGAWAGRVDVYRGSANGLSLAVWFTLWGGADSRLGLALAAGDFDGDGRDELAIGAPEADGVVGDTVLANSGEVVVYQFQAGEWDGMVVFSQAGSVPGDVEAGDRFGTVLEAGDFDGDGVDDLAVGVPGEAVGATELAGAVNVVYGGEGPDGGLGATGSQIFYRSGGGIGGTAEQGESLGSALAAGDFDADGHRDLAIGAPYRTVDGQADAGAVVVLFGSADGLAAAGQQEIDLEALGLTVGGNEQLGRALAAANFNPPQICLFGCADDLAIGAPYEDVTHEGDPIPGAGRVHVLGGSASAGGLDLATLESFDESSIDPTGTLVPGSENCFGCSLAAGRLDRSRGAELAIGVPFDESGLGAAGVRFGGSLAMNGRAPQRLWASPGLPIAPPTSSDRFGSAVAIGDFDGGGYGDLAAGLPGRDSPDAFDAGVVQILYGALFADGFERGSTGGWSAD